MKSGVNAVEVYASNHAVSAAANQMAEHIEKLRQAGLIGAEAAQARIASIEEIRALTNLDVGLNTAQPELMNATRAEQKKLAIEKKWKEAISNREQNKSIGKDVIPRSQAKKRPKKRPSQ